MGNMHTRPLPTNSTVTASLSELRYGRSSLLSSMHRHLPKVLKLQQIETTKKYKKRSVICNRKGAFPRFCQHKTCQWMFCVSLNTFGWCLFVKWLFTRHLIHASCTFKQSHACSKIQISSATKSDFHHAVLLFY